MMTINEIGSLASILGLGLAIISVVIAIIQTIRIKKLKDREYRETWKVIQDIRAVMDESHKVESTKSLNDIHPQIKSIFRHLIMIAVSLEDSFDEAKIQKWIKTNKIGNTDWQRRVVESYLK